jgi:hypothetical protein
MKWKLLGEAGVDSGALMISDPCNSRMVTEWVNGDGMFDDNQMNYPMGHAGLGVQARTAFGDGVYKVYGLCSDDTTRAHAMLVITGDDELPQFPKGGAA